VLGVLALAGAVLRMTQPLTVTPNIRVSTDCGALLGHPEPDVSHYQDFIAPMKVNARGQLVPGHAPDRCDAVRSSAWQDVGMLAAVGLVLLVVGFLPRRGRSNDEEPAHLDGAARS